ncbi:MAG: flagellar hook-associated protein FlgL [Deltaproteobacteria bacterium]|nr:flagellar hook-associated protein FlgL [Deltaproteobacteria bacterium]
MITRVTDNMKFDMLNNSISNTQTQYSELMEKLATEKQVNKPSDDPLGMGKILDYRAVKSYTSHYEKRVEESKSWIDLTESKLSSVNDILNQIRETAISQSSATASESTRQIAADSLQPLIDQLRSLANSKFGDRYLFSGTKTDTEPFSATESAARIDAPVNASGNTYTGTVSEAGTYTGATNKTYVVKIVAGGTLGSATYQVSSDSGKTWVGVPTVLASGSNTLGDGISLTFPPGTFAANDSFSVNAYAPGYYNGNGEELSVEVGKDVAINYSITGEAAFTARGSGTVDIFKTLNDLKTALQNNDAEGIRNQLDPLQEAGDQITRYTAKCGTRVNSLDISDTVLKDLDTRLTGLTSNIEDADVVALMTAFKMKEIALQACYEMAGNLGNISIINFIK